MLKSVEDPAPVEVSYLESARRALTKERKGLGRLIEALDDGLGERFVAAIRLLRQAKGRIVLSGVGKSGHIARKVAATMASTGSPAIFIHPTEASHGDLGMITSDDVIIVLSNSGETIEFRDLLAYSRRFEVPLIAITGNAGSTIAKTAEVVLLIPRAAEACPIGLAPTTSTTMQLALGDALAVTLLEDKGFTASDFRRFHPGGRLGAALTHVRDLMHTQLPLAAADLDMARALILMTEKSFGCLGVVDGDGRLVGIVTDGDLRRKMSAGLLAQPAGEIMTRDPKTVGPDTLAAEALAIMNRPERPITALFVVEDGRPVGIVHVHDLLRTGVL